MDDRCVQRRAAGAASALASLPRDPLQTNYEYADNLAFSAANFTPLREAPNHLTSAQEALATYRMLNSSAAGRTDAGVHALAMAGLADIRRAITTHRLSVGQIALVRNGQAYRNLSSADLRLKLNQFLFDTDQRATPAPASEKSASAA